MSAQASREPSPMGMTAGARRCPVCGVSLASVRARYCSRACQQQAYRLRHHQPSRLDLAAVEADLRGRRQRAEHMVYECPECETRLLGERRCADCNRFCRALGLGGTCPGCDEVLLISELLGEEV